LVDRLVLDGKRACGVCYQRRDGSVHHATVVGEIILAAGAIGSVQILHRSGIGPGRWLQQAGIDCVADRPGVGNNLQDHLQQRAIYRIYGTRTLNDLYHSPFHKGLMALDYVVRRRGPLTMAPSQLGIFTRSHPSLPRANIEFHVQPLSLDKFGTPLHRFSAITVAACNLRPTSRGYVRVTSADVREPPLIAPHYLETEEDRQIAVDAIRLTRQLMRQKALESLKPEEYLPGLGVGDEQQKLLRAAGDIGTTIFHPVGTVCIGQEAQAHAGVDASLRLIGVAGVRVADASVMPRLVSGNTNMPTAMIAMKAADIITSAQKQRR